MKGLGLYLCGSLTVCHSQHGDGLLSADPVRREVLVMGFFLSRSDGGAFLRARKACFKSAKVELNEQRGLLTLNQGPLFTTY